MISPVRPQREKTAPTRPARVRTVPVFAEVVSSGLGRLRFASLVDSPDAELIRHLLFQAVHLHLRLVVRRLRHLSPDR